MTLLRQTLLLTACAFSLSACVTDGIGTNEPKNMQVSGGVYPLPVIDPSVETFNTEGKVANPLDVDRTHSVLDNTTAGGYTVFDESVKVYPLPGDTIPSYVPTYAVPTLKGQDDLKPIPEIARQAPMDLGGPSDMVSTLPPLPEEDLQDANPYAKPPVPGAVRTPMTLTAPEPLTMQPPVTARPPMPSPFVKAAPSEVPVMTQPQTVAGRRSTPLLTGY